MACATKRSTVSGVAATLVACAVARAAEDPLSKDVMSDAIFMKAGWHMKIEAIEEAPDRTIVTTTGAVFEFRAGEGLIVCSQRIGRQRAIVTIGLGEGALAGVRVRARDTGAVILASPAGITAKVNCDSLLMLRAAKARDVAFSYHLTDAVGRHVPGNRLWLDRFGAVGVFPIRGGRPTKPHQAGADREREIFKLDDEGEVWVSIGPPRPYPWKQSLELRPIWQGSWESAQMAVPSDEKIRGYVGRGNLLWLQSENMLWKSWHTAYRPRLPDELRRVIATAHAVGIRVMVYASPYYFTKGLSGTHTNTGENMGLYLQAVEDYLAAFPETDGIYFDGVYRGSVKNTYLCTRATRELIGEDRILMIHDTAAAPFHHWGDTAFNPSSDTWADCTLRGEGFGFVSYRHLRYFVSGYQISNTIGFVCNNAGHYAPTDSQVEMVLRANCRLPYMASDTDKWLGDGPLHKSLSEPARVTRQKHRTAILDRCQPRLNDDYRAWFEAINEIGDFDVPLGQGG